MKVRAGYNKRVSELRPQTVGGELNGLMDLH